ncbi:cytochrome P450 [Vararia minispora EC-137]|uniref:Cytochrome P450 n=1 Tax=Vararia minispora EC-137 TaxID=1314806 RepID=A0ACB8QE59_9AGAM|nr:cytochrome P450 [Vararia minispora EC-137]
MSLWFGHDAIPWQTKVIDEFGSIIRLTGFLGEHFISIADPKALYEILIKDQDTFEEHEGVREYARLVSGGVGLPSAMGDVHFKQRKLMNPAFSVTHMRRMLPLFQSLTAQMIERIHEEIKGQAQETDMSNYIGRLALELIAQAGFGHSFGALDGRSDDDYSVTLRNFAPATGQIEMWFPLIPLLTRYIPGYVLRFIGDRLPWPALHEVMRISDKLQATSLEVWEEKKRLHMLGDKSVVNEQGEGKDIMSILLRANAAASVNERLSDSELLAQISGFTIAGSDTTSNTINRMMYLLATHPEVQEKLRHELVEAGAGSDDMKYDDITSLPYLEAVCRETLRLYPAGPFVLRRCTKDTVLPLSRPYTDVRGKEQKELFIPGGTTIVVAVQAVNRDKAIWGPDAHDWNPDRWMKPLPDTVAAARIPGIYSNTLTFVGGHRACIGFKFAQLEMKVVLSKVIPAFRFAPSEKQEVTWRFGVLVTPSVKGSTTNRPDLPLQLTPIL